MRKWVQDLSTGQKILVRTFFLLLGMGLLVMVFYAGGREMLLLSDKHVKWTGLHTIFSAAGVVSISVSLALTRLTSIFDVVVNVGKKFFKINTNSNTNENDAG